MIYATQYILNTIRKKKVNIKVQDLLTIFKLARKVKIWAD